MFLSRRGFLCLFFAFISSLSATLLHDTLRMSWLLLESHDRTANGPPVHRSAPGPAYSSGTSEFEKRSVFLRKRNDNPVFDAIEGVWIGNQKELEAMSADRDSFYARMVHGYKQEVEDRRAVIKKEYEKKIGTSLDEKYRKLINEAKGENQRKKLKQAKKRELQKAVESDLENQVDAAQLAEDLKILKADLAKKYVANKYLRCLVLTAMIRATNPDQSERRRPYFVGEFKTGMPSATVFDELEFYKRNISIRERRYVWDYFTDVFEIASVDAGDFKFEDFYKRYLIVRGKFRLAAAKKKREFDLVTLEHLNELHTAKGVIQITALHCARNWMVHDFSKYKQNAKELLELLKDHREDKEEEGSTRKKQDEKSGRVAEDLIGSEEAYAARQESKNKSKQAKKKLKKELGPKFKTDGRFSRLSRIRSTEGVSGEALSRTETDAKHQKIGRNKSMEDRLTGLLKNSPNLGTDFIAEGRLQKLGKSASMQGFEGAKLAMPNKSKSAGNMPDWSTTREIDNLARLSRSKALERKKVEDLPSGKLRAIRLAASQDSSKVADSGRSEAVELGPKFKAQDKLSNLGRAQSMETKPVTTPPSRAVTSAFRVTLLKLVDPTSPGNRGMDTEDIIKHVYGEYAGAVSELQIRRPYIVDEGGMQKLFDDVNINIPGKKTRAVVEQELANYYRDFFTSDLRRDGGRDLAKYLATWAFGLRHFGVPVGPLQKLELTATPP